MKTISSKATSMRKTISIILVTLSVAIALAVLLSWFMGRWEWLSLGTGCVPTAPATAILLILLNIILLAEVFKSENTALRRFCRVAAVLITLAGLAVLLRPFWGWSSPLEQWMAGTVQSIDNVPIGQMSPLTGLVLFLTGFASWTKAFRFLDKKWPRRIAFGLNGIVFWISAAVILSYVAGAPLFSSRPIIPMALLTAVIFILLSIAMAMSYKQAESPEASVTPGGKNLVVNKPLWILMSSLVVFAIIAGGIIYLQEEETRIRKEKSEEMAAIGKLKIDQILRWQKERLADITQLSEAPFLIRAFEAWLHKPGDAALKKDIVQRLKLATRTGIYTRVLLTDADAHVLFSFPETVEVGAELRNVVKAAWDRSEALISELHSEVSGEVHVDIAAVMRGVSGRPLAVAVLTNDAREYIFPTIQTWPGHSHSAEAFLVRRDGDDALYLSDLGNRKNTAMTLRIPLTKIEVPAVQAVLGKTGPAIGPDYRGEEVFADLRPVPGTSWHLVTKMDTEEVLKEVRFRAVMTFTVSFILIAGFLGVMALLYQKRLLKEHRQMDLERANMAAIVAFADDAILSKDLKGHILSWNKGAENIYGYKAEEIIGKSISSLTVPGYGDDTQEILEKVSRGESVTHYEAKRVRKDGIPIDVSLTVSPIRDPSGEIIAASTVARDITLHKKTEELLRFNKQKLDLALKSARMGVWQFDLVKNERIFDYKTCALLGIDPATFGGTAEEFFAAVHPEDRGNIREALARTIHDGVPYEPEYRIVWSDGSIHHIAGRGELVHDNQGKPLMINGIIWDITERKRAEEMIRLASLYARNLIETSLDPLVTISAEGKITDVNKATEKATGLNREKIIGTDFADYFTEPAKAREGYQQVFLAGTVRDYPLTLRHASGDTLDVLYNASIYKNQAGEVQGVFAAARDITKRKQLERERDLNEARLVEAQAVAKIGSWETNLTNMKVVWSEQVYRIFEIDPDSFQASHASFLSWVHPEDRVKVDAAFAKSFDKTTPNQIEHRIVTPGGLVKFVEQRWQISHDDQARPMRAMGTCQDITVRKKAEEEIKKLNAELEDRVRQRTMELAAAVKDLEAFSYSIAHDLKAPLRAMAGFANILTEDYAPKLDDNGRRVIGVINDNARNMGQLIDDLLTLSQSGRKPLEAVEVDMKVLAQSIIRELKENLFRDRVIEVSVGSLLPVRADAVLARQIFTNLLSNAMKFTARQEKAVIEIGSYDKEEERVYYVKDNGVGFDMKYAEMLFGVFQRLHGKDAFAGTGIGLAIVRSAVQRHGGRVWAQGEVGQGATFYFALPKGKGA